MLVTLKEILAIAEEKHIAVGSFNTPNLASLRGIIAAAEELNQPVILMHAQVHEEMGLCTMEEVAPIMLAAAKRAKVPVCVHLDHGTDLDYIKRGLELGFTGVMFDGSALPVEENFAKTREAVLMAAKTGASVEAEIGSMGSREGGNAGDMENPESIYTDPDMAVRFVAETGIDALACAFGTVHGIYLKEPKLDFDRLAKIDSMVSVPLVMHGGSGVSPEDYRKVIARGVAKINYYTYMAKAGAEAINGKTFTQYHDIVTAATQAIKEDVMKAMRVFSGL
ncbi:MAG: class II fructose-bisphosphate aldolase [Clostridia bacterium]|nr:class II fructose-bisphosphate aldolase [Clostridia bacterium]